MEMNEDREYREMEVEKDCRVEKEGLRGEME